MSDTWILSIKTAPDGQLGSDWSLSHVNCHGSRSIVSASWSEFTPTGALTSCDVEDYIASELKDEIYVNNMFTVILRRYGYAETAGTTALVIQDLVPTECIVLRGLIRREVKDDLQNDTAEKR